MKDINDNYYFDDSMNVWSRDRIITHKNGTKRLYKGKQNIFTKSKSGYLVVRINNKLEYVHKLIWETFNGPVPKGCDIHHKDFNKLNNNLDNLQCLTYQEHYDIHSVERHKKQRISNDKIQKIYELGEQGLTLRQIADEVGCSYSTVGRYLRKRR